MGDLPPPRTTRSYERQALTLDGRGLLARFPPTARRSGLALAAALAAACGTGGPLDPGESGGPVVIQPGEACPGGASGEVEPFADPNLEAAVRAARGVGPDVTLTCGLLAGLTALDASARGITDLEGLHSLTSLEQLALWSNAITDVAPLEALTNLRSLSLRTNAISDIEALRGLTNLTSLDLGNNDVSDIRALSGLTALTWLGLEGNSITDVGPLEGLTNLMFLILRGNSSLSVIQPLLDNSGIGSGDSIRLQATSVSCTDVGALEARGATVLSDCP